MDAIDDPIEDNREDVEGGVGIDEIEELIELGIAEMEEEMEENREDNEDLVECSSDDDDDDRGEIFFGSSGVVVLVVIVVTGIFNDGGCGGSGFTSVMGDNTSGVGIILGGEALIIL